MSYAYFLSVVLVPLYSVALYPQVPAATSTSHRVHPQWPTELRYAASTASAATASASGSPARTTTASVHGDDNMLDIEEVPPISAKRSKVVSDLHLKLAWRFPGLFHTDQEVVPYYESSPASSSAPLLRLDPDLSRSWLRPPVSVSSDTMGYWGAESKLPPSRKSLLPPSTKKKALQRPPFFHVTDQRLQDMLSETTLDKVYLDLKAFDASEVVVRKSPHALLDSHLRTSLQEVYATDAYLLIILELSKCAAGTSDIVPQEEAIELLTEVSRQAATAAARSLQSLTAAFVSNRVALRDVALDKFSAPTRTKDVLRGGDFSGPGLFSPVPESFGTLLESPQGASLRCKSKASASGKFFPRPSGSSSSRPAKRPSSSSAPPPKRFQAPAAPSAPAKAAPWNFQRKPAARGSRGGRF